MGAEEPKPVPKMDYHSVRVTEEAEYIVAVPHGYAAHLSDEGRRDARRRVAAEAARAAFNKQEPRQQVIEESRVQKVGLTDAGMHLVYDFAEFAGKQTDAEAD